MGQLLLNDLAKISSADFIVLDGFDLFNAMTRDTVEHYWFCMGDVAWYLNQHMSTKTVCLGAELDGDKWASFINDCKAAARKHGWWSVAKWSALPLWGCGIDMLKCNAESGCDELRNGMSVPLVVIEDECHDVKGGTNSSIMATVTVYLPSIRISCYLHSEVTRSPRSFTNVVRRYLTSGSNCDYENNRLVISVPVALPWLQHISSCTGSRYHLTLGEYHIIGSCDGSTAKLLGAIMGLLHACYLEEDPVAEMKCECLVNDISGIDHTNIIVPTSGVKMSSDYYDGVSMGARPSNVRLLEQATALSSAAYNYTMQTK